MNSNQRSEANNQSNNGGNELAESSSRAFSSSKRAGQDQAPQSGGQQPGGQQPAPTRGDSMQAGSNDSAQSVDRAGSQTGTLGQGLPAGHESNDVAGGMPKSPGGQHLAADQKMDDDTGLSNTANRAATGLDEGIRQEQQSNVGRRSDGTPD
ncbi:MAG: hypothetical protein JWR65_3127 [Massilia sp.]|jgi:hypothetical protein|nr:hypothetical protein [Massilia sp.]